MKKYWWLVLVSAMLAVVVLIPAVASAARISSGGRWIDTFSDMDTKTYLDGSRIDEQESDLLSGGWYLVSTKFGKVYVRSSDVTVLRPDPVVTAR